MARTIADLMAETLLAAGVERIYGVAGDSLNGFTDITQQGDAPIYRLSATAGYGDLQTQGFNIMGAVSKSWNGVLYGRDRDFVKGNQPNRGLSIDTRGTPIATAAGAALRSVGCSRTRSAPSAATATAAAATGSGLTVVAHPSATGESPTTAAALVAHGSGTRRRASAAAATNPRASSAATTSSAPVGPASA